MMEEVGYIAETIARTHRQKAPEEGDEQALMQGRKKLKRGEGRRREGERTDDYDEEEGDEVDRLLRQQCRRVRQPVDDPVPREEHLTAEDWAIMTAVENCVV